MWTRLTTAQLSDLSDAEILEYYRQGGPEAFLDVRDEHDDQWPGKTFVYNLPIGANDEIKAIRAKAVEMARKSNSNKN